MNRIWRIWQRLSRREKGLMIATVVVFVLLVGRSLVFNPFLDRREWVKNQLDLEPQRLDKNLRYVGRKTDIMADLGKARAELRNLEPLLLTGDTPSVSASDLQQTVQGFASRGGTQVVSTRVLNPEPMGTFTRIPIQLEVSGLIDQVAGLIQGIESAPKLLVINEINVRSFAVVGAVPRRPDGTSALPPQNLRVSLTVSGYIRPQPLTPPKEAALPGAKAQPGKDKGPPQPAKEPESNPVRRRFENN